MAINLNFFAICTAAAIALPYGSFAGGTLETADLTAADLRDAIAGQSIVHRGRVMEGDIAASFADGYIFAIAESAERNGDWCGMETIAPHELISRVFERLSEAEDVPAQPANAAIREILVRLGPC